MEELTSLVHSRIEGLRTKLLDLSRKNPLVSTKLTGRSSPYIRAVDELPDVLFFGLSQQKKFRFEPLPALDADPADEQSEAFRDAFSAAQITDDDYARAIDSIDAGDEDALETQRAAERMLRDSVRAELRMAPRQTRAELSVAQHARNNNISPSYELPSAGDEHDDGRHTDDAIQTLLLGDALERTANRLISKTRTWQQETGLNVLHAAFGFLEWEDASDSKSSYSPLVLVPVTLEKKKSPTGPVYELTGTGESAEMNTVLAEKLRLEMSTELPPYDGGSIEDYFAEVAAAAPQGLKWVVHRYVAFGVFPSSRLAMYHDLDTTGAGFTTTEIVDQLLGGSDVDGQAGPFAKEYEVDTEEIESKVPLLVADADSSQFSTMVDIADGKNLAVEGPPGTGKSQTIINTIAAALSSGKKVLFVAEKLAALEVVRSRLEAMGLGEFLLPLQATRASHRQVIDSIRQRIQIERIGAPASYQQQLQAYRSARESIASYIAVISANYHDTDFTVHEILGRSMLTSQYLEECPRSLQSPPLTIAENFNRQRIEEVKELGRALVQAWQGTRQAGQHWAGIQRGNLDRFQIDDILNRATDIAEDYDGVDELRSTLGGFGIPLDANSGSILRLQQSLVSLCGCLSAIDRKLVDALAEENRLDELVDLLDDCEVYREEREALAAELVEPLDSRLANNLAEAHRLCEAHSLSTIDIDALTRANEENAEELRKLVQTHDQLAVFLAAAPELSEAPVSALAAAGRIVAETPPAVLALRTAQTTDPSIVPTLERAIGEGTELSRRRAEFETDFIVEALPPATELSASAQIIRGAGFFSLLSGKFRRAKKAYISIARRRESGKVEIAESLESLAKWKAAAEEFSDDSQLHSVFGGSFKGIDTNFELYLSLLEFLREIDSSFPRLTRSEIRNFLRSAELDLLLAMPTPDLGNVDSTFDSLGQEIEAQRNQATRLGQAVEQLRPLVTVVKGANTAPGDLPRLLDRLSTHIARGQHIESSPVAPTVGSRFEGVETKKSKFIDEINAARTLLESSEWNPALRDLLLGERLERARDAVDSFLLALRSVESSVEELRSKTGTPPHLWGAGIPFDQIAHYWRTASQDREGLLLYCAYFAATQELRAKGLGEPLNELLHADQPLEQLPEILEAIVVRALSMKVYQEYGGALTRFPGVKLDELRKRLATLDRKVIEMARTYLRAKLIRDAKPPTGNGRGRKSTWTESALLNNEINKQRAHRPARDLTLRAGRALAEIKPCWMMSPLSIAQYLPRGTTEFDLCIIDEASQMPPENAVGALLRAKQTMIVGDRNQLPPTSFFRKLIADDDSDDDETVLEESILEMANTTFRPARRLRWHYRSRHASLIRFSNRLVYDDDLIVFPSATDARGALGVSIVEVEGLYRSGTNPVEAKKVVDAAVTFMHAHPTRSLGIVTLNQKQRDLIQEEFEHALSRDTAVSDYVEDWQERSDGLESFFVKNLENVQGDERDVIFISTVYGPETLGARVNQRFGPINGLAGRRRLNVLFSRAKKQIVTFSSMTAADILSDENSNPGTYMLKRWLQYSSTGVLDSGDETRREPDSDFEEFVAQQIRAMGCEAVPQVGVAGYFVDIGVKHPSWPHGYLLGVECDGASYHSAKSARDRDRLRQEVLEGLGWHFHRIWSTDWFNDPRAEAERIRRRIEERLSEEAAKANRRGATETANYQSEPRVSAVPPRDVGEPKQQLFQFDGSAPQKVTDSDAEVATGPGNNNSSTAVSVGDTVEVRYPASDAPSRIVTISDSRDEPSEGIIHVSKPLAQALLGAEPEDEVEVLIGNRVKTAVVARVTKG